MENFGIEFEGKFYKGSYNFDILPNKEKIRNLFSLLLQINVGDVIEVTEAYIYLIQELQKYTEIEIRKGD